MRQILILTFIFPAFISIAQKDLTVILQENVKYRAEMNAEFADPKTSPLEKKDIPKFDSLPFFPIDTAYYVISRLERIENGKVFEMPTTTERRPQYRLYGVAHFTLRGQDVALPVYQNLRLQKTPGYEDYLFVPFTDHTNGEETYGGGRYLDVRIPDGDELILDFNKAYNPLCAYSDRFSCPIPPKENAIQIRIPAGVQYVPHH